MLLPQQVSKLQSMLSSFPVLLLVAVAISKAWEVFVAIIGWNVGEALISVKTSPLLCYLGFVAKELRTHGMFFRVCATETNLSSWDSSTISVDLNLKHLSGKSTKVYQAKYRRLDRVECAECSACWTTRLP